MSQIENQVVLITGASSGIGEALAYELSSLGAHMVLASRRLTELERVREGCNAKGTINLLPIDLADTSSLADKAAKAESFHGHIDIVIHCGGISQRDKIINTDLSVDRRIMEVNYFGTIALTKALLPKMIRRKSGHQVVITSATGIISTPLRSSYAASKHALHGFFDALRAEHYADNLKVSIVLPGYVRTNISYNALMGDGKTQDKMDEGQANGLSAQSCAKEIAKAILKDKEEVYIGGFKEVAGIYLKRFLPSVFSKVVRKTAVT